MYLCATNKIFFPVLIHISDDIDHFQQVKQNRQNYNEILENFLMEQQNQQRKQFQTINADEEFSDEVNIEYFVRVRRKFHENIYSQDDINTMRVPNISSQRSRQQPSSSGFSFTSHRQSSSTAVPSSFNFAQNKYRPDSDVQFQSRRQAPKPRPLPELVPIARSIPSQNGVRPNGFGNVSQSQSRRSVLDFTNKNRVSPVLRRHSKVLPEFKILKFSFSGFQRFIIL
jgi:hypothetical protein